MKQKGIKTILMLLCVCPFLQAQHTRSDNLTYFYDISLDGGVYIPTGDKRLSSGSSVSLSGSCYLTDKIGFRTGITRITE
ncbi:MAG: hypothetical protein LBR34_10310, partial [Prevotella sp.]|nr:hypothetical protein [Prevotella sp.]